MAARNTALSDYGQLMADERQRLLSHLVQRLAGVQLSDEQHGALLESCMAVVQHNRFADTNPREVEELYGRLGERFGEYAQFDKQRALQLLQRHLLGLQIQSFQYEFPHRLLAFLYAASQSPLSAAYGGSELVDRLEAEARNAIVGPPTFLPDVDSDDGGSSSGDSGWQGALGANSPGSQLSEWSHADTEGEPDRGGDVEGDVDADAGAAGEDDLRQDDSTGRELATGSAAAVAGPPVADPLLAPAARPGSAAAAPSPQPRRAPPYTRASLSVWLASRRSGGQPARLLEPRLCFTEPELVQQVVHMLKGLSSPGPALQFNPSTNSYAPTPGVHLHTSSHSSLRALLARFARCGSQLRRVQAFCAAAQAAAGMPPGPEDGSSTSSEAFNSSGLDAAEQLVQQRQRLLRLPTVAAFAAAVGEQHTALQQQLLAIETALQAGTALTLLQLQQQTTSLAQQAAALDGLIARCCRWHGSAAETAAGLLSGLYEALQVALLEGRSQGGTLAAMLLHIFAASCRPLLAVLHGWLYRGVLQDPWGEFFVQKASGPDIPTDSPRFWSEAYTLRTLSSSSSGNHDTAAGSGGSASSGGAGSASVPAAPCFLRPLAGGILAAGKAALLLQAYSSWRLAAAAAHGGAANDGGRGVLPAPELTPAAAAAPDSPSKRRLSEYGALGFAIAAGPQQKQGGQWPAAAQLYGAPSAPAPDSLALAEEGFFDELGKEPAQLHQQLLRSLERHLEEHWLLASSAEAGTALPHQLVPAQQQEQKQQRELAKADDLVEGGKSQGMADGSSTPGSSRSSGSHACLEEWRQHSASSAAACGEHALLLPDSDALPPLAALPASPEGLPAAKVAVIAPADPAAGFLVSCGLHTPPEHCPPASTAAASSSQPTVAERMQRAAAARARQPAHVAAEQLPTLLIPPAPLEALASAAERAAAGTNSSRSSKAGGTTGGGHPEKAGHPSAGATGAAAAEAAEFDSTAWQRYYCRVSAALAQQLDVLDCLGGGGTVNSTFGGISNDTARRKLASSYGVPLGLPRYTGCPSEQLWGRDAGYSSRADAASALVLQQGSLQSSQARPPTPGMQRRQQQAQLRPELAAQAPPLDVLLQRCLLAPLAARVEVAEGALCAALLRRGLLQQLSSLSETYLLGSPLLEPFVSFLLRRISTTSGGMDQLSEADLNAALQDSLEAGGQAGKLRVSAQTLPAAAVAGASARQPNASAALPGVPRVQQLSRLRLRVEPGWPLCLVAGEEMLQQYNAVHVLLLQLRWAKQSLQAVRYAGWKAGRRSSQGAAARDGLQHQMVHLVEAVQQYINDRVVAAGAWLEQALAGCTSLDQMHACRAKYLRAVTRYCLLSPEGVSRLVHEGILHLLNACLQYCSLRKQESATEAALAALAQMSAAEALLGGAGGRQQEHAADADAEEHEGGGMSYLQQELSGAGSSAAAPSQVQRWAGRKAELARRRTELATQLAALRKDFANRQRLLLRVLSTKAAEAGSHADELSQLLAALDFSGYFARSMA